MATKILANSGGHYADFATWITYLKTLGTLTATEYGKVSGEFDGGNAQLTGAGCAPTATYKLILTCADSGKFSGNPLRYGDGGRILLNGANEEIFLNWAYTVIQDLAINKSSTGTTAGIGALSITGNIDVAISNVQIELNSVQVHGIDDRAAAGVTRENIQTVRNGGNNYGGIRCANQNKTYLNCSSHAFGSPTGGTGMEQAFSTATWINCESLGYATDFSASYGAGSKNCATDKASGASNIAAMTGAQFSVAGGTEHEAWGTYGSHDLRVKSTSTQIKDAGAASGGSTADIIGNSASGTRDIGPFEYQAAAGGLAANPLLGGGAAAHPLGGFVV